MTEFRTRTQYDEWKLGQIRLPLAKLFDEPNCGCDCPKEAPFFLWVRKMKKNLVILMVLSSVCFGWQWNYTPPSGGTATFVVAANDAPNHVKQRADYVCDGTADDIQIQAALDALPAPGGGVCLSGGNFTISSTIALPDNATLGGVGYATTIELAASSDTVMIDNDDQSSGNSNICIRNLTLDGNYANQSAAVGYHGIYWIKPTNCIIENVQINDCRGWGLFVTTDAHGKYVNVVCDGPAAGGDGYGCIRIDANDTYMAFCVARNSLYTTRVGGAYGFWLMGTNLTMIECIGTNNWNENLVFSDITNATIIGGSFSGSTNGSGMHINSISSNHDITFVGTLFDDNNNGGTTVDNATYNITFIKCSFTNNNSVGSASYDGINLDGVNHTFSQCVFSDNGNTSTDVGNGMLMKSTSLRTTIRDCLFQDNGNDGLRGAGSYHIIDSCTFDSNDDNGLVTITGMSHSKFTNCRVFNNGDEGMSFYAGTNFLIYGNTFYDDQGTASQKHLQLAAACNSGVKIIGNYFGTAEADVLVIDNTAGVAEFKDNTGYDDKWGAIGVRTFGDGTNKVQISATGNQTFAGTAGFYPRFLTQADEPAAGTGATQLDTSEICIWKDSDDNKVYFCFNDGGTIKTAEAL